MISLEDYKKNVYQFALHEDVEAHLRETVFHPLNMISHEEKCNRSEGSRGEPEAIGIYATPPCTTCIRLTGRYGESCEFPSPACTGEQTGNSHPSHNQLTFQPISTFSDIGLPYCFAIRPRIPKPCLFSSTWENEAESLSSCVIVVVDVGCSEAVLRGSDVYAPGVLTVSKPFVIGQRVLLVTQIEKQRTKSNTQSSSEKSTEANSAPQYQWKTTLSRGRVIPQALMRKTAITDSHASGRALSDFPIDDGINCLVIIGGGIALMDSKTFMSDAKMKGVAISVEWNVWSQPSRSHLQHLLDRQFPHMTEWLAREKCVAERKEPNIFLQNYSSMLPVKLLVDHLPSSAWRCAQSSERGTLGVSGQTSFPCVLDACAAPGGKTSLLLSLLAKRAEEETKNENSQGGDNSAFRLLCCERSRTRHKQMEKTLQEHFDANEEGSEEQKALSRWLIKVCRCLCKDMNQLVKEKEQQPQQPQKTAARLQQSSFLEFTAKENGDSGSLDAILLDPPCTGMGLRPKLLPHSHTLADIENSADYQRKLFDSAMMLIEKSSSSSNPKIVVYSTCTITREENEQNVLHFLRTYDNIVLARANGEKETALCTFSASVFPATGEGNTAPEKRFLLEEEILALQVKKEEKLFLKCTASRRVNPNLSTSPVLVLRLMPKPCISPPLEDGVGFFVAVFEVWNTAALK